MTRLGMVMDLDRCIGCWACAIACAMENHVPQGLWWQQVLTVGGNERDTSGGEFPSLIKSYQPTNCAHCAEPPCIPACPTEAIYKRADGIVLIDYDACNGCRDCIPACPYDAFVFNAGEPLAPGVEPGDGAAEVMPRRPGVVEKCTFCVHRVDQGLAPACVAACPTGVIAFGDIADPESEVARKAARPGAVRDKPELGADPSLVYLPYTKGARQRRSGYAWS